MGRMKRLLSYLLCGVMIFSVMPMILHAEDALLEVVYTDYILGDDNNTGASGAPVKSMERAVELVAAGGTIIIEENGAYANKGDDMVPLVIDKPLTIRSENNSNSNLNVRRAGIILGADVSFENICLSFENREKNAIFANGHTLTLTNVTRQSGTREVHLFAGGLQGNATPSGSEGKIIINGAAAQFGNIYAGAMDGASDLPATITINGAANMSIGNIFACGAAKGIYDSNDLFSGNEPEVPQPSTDAYPVNSTVVVELNNSNITMVDGSTGGSNSAEVRVSTQNLNCVLNLKHVGKLVVNSGTVQPMALNSGLDVQVKENGILDLSTVAAGNGNAFTVRNFDGGGILRMGWEDTLTISDYVTGNTEFQTTESIPVAGDTSGIVKIGHTYINAPESTAEDAFTFVPNFVQDYAEFVAENGKFTAKAGTHACLAEPYLDYTEIMPSSGNVAAGNYYLGETIEAQGDIYINGDVELCMNGYAMDMGDYTLYVNGDLNIVNCWDLEMGAIVGAKDAIVVGEDHVLALNNITVEGLVRNYGTLSQTGCDFMEEVWNYGSLTGDDISTNTVESVDISFNLSNFAAGSPTQGTVSIKNDYTCTLTPAEGYVLPTTITLSINGMNVAADTAYTYDRSTGKLTIKAAAINGAIAVTAECEQEVVQPPHVHSGGTATCVSAAICSGCGVPYTDIDRNNHVGATEIRGTIQATATQDGYTGDTYCTSCQNMISAGTSIPATGSNPGGNEPGGNEPNGNEPGGNNPGGNMPGGSESGGNMPGGSESGGNNPGGNVPGGSESGGNMPGGSESEGNMPGGSESGGNNPGGNVPGGNEPEGNTPEDTPSGDNTPGGSTSEDTPGGDNTPGGSTPEDTPGGDNTPTDTPTEDNSGDSEAGNATDSEAEGTVSYVQHVIRRGETLWALARRYGCSVNDILAANNGLIRVPNTIVAGWQIVIPQGGLNGNQATTIPTDGRYVRYEVQSGDSLWKIARRYNCSISYLISLNRDIIRNPNVILAGWELKVPQ